METTNTPTKPTTPTTPPVENQAVNNSAPKDNTSAAPVQTPKDEWNPDTFKKISDKFKGNPEEIAKAYWNSTREYSKLAAEAKKNTPAPKPEAGTEKPDYKPLFNKAADIYNHIHTELLNSGTISDDTKAVLTEAGYSEADINRELKVRAIYMDEQMKSAQKYAEVPVQELLKFAKQEGNFTDRELAFIQQGINAAQATGDPSYYRVIKIVEDRYKSKQPTNVEHGTVSNAPAYSGEGFASAKEYVAAKKDPRYGSSTEYTRSVDQRFKVSNTDNWTRQMLG